MLNRPNKKIVIECSKGKVKGEGREFFCLLFSIFIITAFTLVRAGSPLISFFHWNEKQIDKM